MQCCVSVSFRFAILHRFKYLIQLNSEKWVWKIHLHVIKLLFPIWLKTLCLCLKNRNKSCKMCCNFFFIWMKSHKNECLFCAIFVAFFLTISSSYFLVRKIRQIDNRDGFFHFGLSMNIFFCATKSFCSKNLGKHRKSVLRLIEQAKLISIQYWSRKNFQCVCIPVNRIFNKETFFSIRSLKNLIELYF